MMNLLRSPANSLGKQKIDFLRICCKIYRTPLGNSGHIVERAVECCSYLICDICKGGAR